MMKHGIDQDALIEQFSTATARQGETLRKAVHEATLKALQGRELTLSHIKQVLNTVAKATSAGAAQSSLGVEQVEALLAKAFAGMDGALQQAVQANRRALQQLLEHGASLRETQLKKAVADVEKMEEVLFSAVRKGASAVGGLETPWDHVLKGWQDRGTATGNQVHELVQGLMDQTQQTLREGRAMGLKVSQALLDGYGALVSGVLIGMSEALEPQAPARSGSKKASSQ